MFIDLIIAHIYISVNHFRDFGVNELIFILKCDRIISDIVNTFGEIK